MKLWLLSQVADDETMEAWQDEDSSRSYSPFFSPRGYVIVAESESGARGIASGGPAECGDGARWRNPRLTSCQEITAGGPARIILTNQPTG